MGDEFNYNAADINWLGTPTVSASGIGGLSDYGSSYNPSSAAFTTPNIAASTSNTGPNYLGWANTAMSGLNAIGSIMGARTAKKNYKLQRDAFNFNKEMQSATTLANIQNRMNQYRAVNPNANVSHLESLASRLQSYLPNQQAQQQVAPVNQTQQPAAQNTSQPVGKPAGYDSLARYGRGG